MLTNAQLKVRDALYAIIREEAEKSERPVETSDEVLTVEKHDRIKARRKKRYLDLREEVIAMLVTLELREKSRNA